MWFPSTPDDALVGNRAQMERLRRVRLTEGLAGQAASSAFEKGLPTRQEVEVDLERIYAVLRKLRELREHVADPV